jgi:hypothetical protein
MKDMDAFLQLEGHLRGAPRRSFPPVFLKLQVQSWASKRPHCEAEPLAVRQGLAVEESNAAWLIWPFFFPAV